MDAVTQTGTAISRFAAKAFKDTRTAAFTVGVGTVVVTHSLMLVLPNEESSRYNHAIINLTAAAAIVYGSRVFG